MDRTHFCLVALFTCRLAAAAAGSAPHPPGRMLFRAALDGGIHAHWLEAEVPGTTAAHLGYDPSDGSQALRVAADTRVQFQWPGPVPPDTGALELRFRPDFQQDSTQPPGAFLTLEGADGTALILSYNPNGVRWRYEVRAGKWYRELPVWHGKIKQSQWSHLLLTWDRSRNKEDQLTLYHDGVWAASADLGCSFAGLGELTLHGVEGLPIRVDEIALYDRAFRAEHAATLAQSFGGEAPRPEAAADILRGIAATEAARRSLVARLDGKVGRLIHYRGEGKPREFDFPEGIKAAGIWPQHVEQTDLSQFDVIYFPEGPKYDLTPAAEQKLRAFVERGGGYVGSCPGSLFARKIKLFDFEAYTFWVWGILKVTLRPHIITDGRKDVVPMHFGNGPLMVPGPDCEVLGHFVTSWPYGGRPAAILTGMCGKGRAVLFGPHPIGGEVNWRRKRIYYTGAFLGSDRFLSNALLYAAGHLAPPEE